MQNVFFAVLFGFVVWVVAAGQTSAPPETQIPAPPQVISATTNSTPTPPASTNSSVFSKPIASNFSCDERLYCSQMNSLAEAEFFTRNCPNTRMDGDNDGEPCENDSRLRANR